MTPEQWTEVIGTNLTGLFNMTRQVWEGMRTRKFGRVVNISSINGQKGQAGQPTIRPPRPATSASPRLWRRKARAPASPSTRSAPAISAPKGARHRREGAGLRRILPHIPVGRLGEPEEIARSVLYLVAEEAGFITGSTLTINGGQYFH